MSVKKTSAKRTVRTKPESRAKQANGGRFLKGQSGNPGGRPKVAGHIRELARKHGPDAIAKLVELMHGDDGRIARAAATDLLDRGYGKPSQPIGGAEDLPAIEVRDMTDAQLLATAQSDTRG